MGLHPNASSVLPSSSPRVVAAALPRNDGAPQPSKPKGTSGVVKCMRWTRRVSAMALEAILGHAAATNDYVYDHDTTDSGEYPSAYKAEQHVAAIAQSLDTVQLGHPRYCSNQVRQQTLAAAKHSAPRFSSGQSDAPSEDTLVSEEDLRCLSRAALSNLRLYELNTADDDDLPDMLATLDDSHWCEFCNRPRCDGKACCDATWGWFIPLSPDSRETEWDF